MILHILQTILDRAIRSALVAIGLGILAADLWRDRRVP